MWQDQYEYTYMVMKSLCNEWLVSFTDHDYENVTISTPTEERPEEVYFFMLYCPSLDFFPIGKFCGFCFVLFFVSWRKTSTVGLGYPIEH